jgi:hypothetical protein
MSAIPTTGFFEKTKCNSALKWLMGAVMVGGVWNRRTKAITTAMIGGKDLKMRTLIGLDNLSDLLES